MAGIPVRQTGQTKRKNKQACKNAGIYIDRKIRGAVQGAPKPFIPFDNTGMMWYLSIT